MSNFVETTRDIISTNTRYGMHSWGPRGLPEFPLDSVPPDATIMSYSPESVEKLASFQSFSILRTAALGITKVVAKTPLPPQTIGGRPVSRFGRRSGNKAERSSRRYHPAGTHPSLHNQLGGAPFGPAGTGKAESVKAFGVEMGQFLAVS
ncbi:hypothetical protein F5878DRAFT_664988 [Lentinula raphanica]|uniref:Dynein heavy chain hydrolytic ATP-binding dynein motor region domain-containing protein n=1 Tax=Lentinula raphanica TaxID=153919 RepID=A0AA38UDH1_9AGAR|nr:hypothetical protein F5878DRAFT_664988 [Lentinula raphanica]